MSVHNQWVCHYNEYLIITITNDIKAIKATLLFPKG